MREIISVIYLIFLGLVSIYIFGLFLFINSILFNMDNPDFIYEQEGATQLWLECIPQILTIVTFSPLVISAILLGTFIWINISKKIKTTQKHFY